LYCYKCGQKIFGKSPWNCEGCGNLIWKNPRCCSGALILKLNSVFLVKRAVEPWCEHWDIPGGFCEEKETPKDCAIRETFEETSLKIHIDSIFGIWNDKVNHEYYGDNICIYFLAHIFDSKNSFKANSEIIEGKWFDFDTIPKKLAFPSHVPKVLESLKNIQK